MSKTTALTKVGDVKGFEEAAVVVGCEERG